MWVTLESWCWGNRFKLALSSGFFPFFFFVFWVGGVGVVWGQWGGYNENFIWFIIKYDILKRLSYHYDFLSFFPFLFRFASLRVNVSSWKFFHSSVLLLVIETFFLFTRSGIEAFSMAYLVNFSEIWCA